MKTLIETMIDTLKAEGKKFEFSNDGTFDMLGRYLDVMIKRTYIPNKHKGFWKPVMFASAYGMYRYGFLAPRTYVY